MAQFTSRDKQEFLVLMGQLLPKNGRSDVLKLCRELQRYASRLQTINLAYVNAEIDTPTWEGKKDAVCERITQLVRPYRRSIVGVVFSGDPRGYAVILKLRNGANNSFACEGWGVPQ